MKIAAALIFLFGVATQTNVADFKLALPTHPGQLQWRAEGFKIVEASAKPDGVELGVRGIDESRRLTFLAFLFLFPEQAPMTGLKCRDGILEPAKKADPKLKIGKTSTVVNSDGGQIELVSYTEGNGDQYTVRVFVADKDICGDIEFYSRAPISPDDDNIKQIVESLRFNPNYVPRFDDALLYAQVLYTHGMYKAAAPVFETAIEKLKDSKDASQKTMLRVATDKAGIAYGIAGDIPKARALFEATIKTDPDYPMYYYLLACADAEEGKLKEARAHLEQAFARKANVIPGETMPDPTKDDSFLPHKSNKEFWSFLEKLR